jgi:hypothetical protein
VSSPPSPSPAVIEHENIWPQPSRAQQPSQQEQTSSSSSPLPPGDAFPLSPSHTAPTPPPVPGPPPRSFSSIFEAYYLFYAKFILGNKTQKKGKKLKKKKSPIPSRDVYEGFDVLRYMINEINDKKFLNKSFVTIYLEKVTVCQRELPLYKEDMSERQLYVLCVELIKQLQVESPALLIAKNELMVFRQILGYIFGLYGIIYECCVLLLDEIIPARYATPTATGLTSTMTTTTTTTTMTNSSTILSSSPPPQIPLAYVELVEKISLLIFPKIFGGDPKVDYLNLGHTSAGNDTSSSTTPPETINKEGRVSPTSPSKNQKTKKGNGKSLKGSTKVTARAPPVAQGPLQPYEIIQRMNIALSDFSSTLKSFSLDSYFDFLQKWIHNLLNKRAEGRVDRSWDVCSKIISPENVYPICSEDRHIICGYQVSFHSFIHLILFMNIPLSLSLCLSLSLSLLSHTLSPSLSLSLSLSLSVSVSLFCHTLSPSLSVCLSLCLCLCLSSLTHCHPLSLCLSLSVSLSVSLFCHTLSPSLSLSEFVSSFW